MSSGAQQLRDAILQRGRVEGSLLKVDDFLNHRVDPALVQVVGAELATHFAAAKPDLVLTAEASGIPPGLACAFHLGVPMIYAKKFLGVGDRHSFFRDVTSPTKGTEYRVEVSRRVMEAGRRVLIIDDFLSRGRTAEALGEITEEAASEIVGLGFVIEKSFEGGRERLEEHGWPVFAMAQITSMQGGEIELAPLPGTDTVPG